MSDAPLVRRLAEFAVATRTSGPPAAVVRSTAGRVMDTVGIAVAAADLPTTQAVRKVVRVRGGAGQAQAVGCPERLPASEAALLNGVMAHSLDFDDTHLPSVLHPSAAVVPTGLAVGELADADGAAVLAATAVGIELCVRLGMAGYDEAAGNSLFFERGQHATAICGAVGAAATAALLLGEDVDGVAHALGLAVSMASGVLEGNRTGGTVKRLHCGFAARSGVEAGELAAAGMTGPPTALEGRFGFFEAFLAGRWFPPALTRELGSEWEVPGIHIKPYPANHFTHTAIDAARALRDRGVAADEVHRIVIRVATPTVRTIGEPIERKRAPRNGYEAQFSGPFVVAAVLRGARGGLGLGLDDFDDGAVADPHLRQLMERVEVVSDPACDRVFPREFPAIVTVETHDGDVMTEQVMTNRGGPQRPLSDEELAAKFTDNARRGLADDRVDELRSRLSDVAKCRRVRDVLSPAAEDRALRRRRDRH